MKNKVRNNLGRSIRLFISGGARLPPKIAKDLTKVGFKIVEGYGLTETSPVVTLNPPEKIKFGSVGKPIPDVQIKILNPDKSGIGEVLIKGPNVMRGYFKRPDLTAQVITEGWFHSGDLGYIDKDGYLFLTGREKDMIVLSSGKNIYPEELEEFFLSQSPFIKEICILGAKDYKFAAETESLYAVIVPNFEYFRQNNLVNIQRPSFLSAYYGFFYCYRGIAPHSAEEDKALSG
jgi:long-chain acyl-CoA synthetase